MRIMGFIPAGLFVLLCVLLVPILAHAQFLGNLSGVKIVLRPAYPQPNQNVEARVNAANVDLQSATAIWLLDGVVEQQGSANDSFIFTTGAPGSTQTLNVLVNAIDGQASSDTIVVRPAEVTLLWEALTWTPPFYKGRAFYTSGSLIRLEAVPDLRDTNGRKYATGELIYTWSRNGTVLGSLSGLGRSSLTLEGPKFYGDDIVSVEVTAPGSSITGSAGVLVETREPDLVLYENDPLIGTMYHRAIGSEYTPSGLEPGIAAAPYYMDAARANDPSLVYRWRVDGTQVSVGSEDLSKVTLRFEGERGFTARMELTIEHARHLLQTAENSWTFRFEESARITPFGRLLP